MMWAWLVGVPLFGITMLFALAWLESSLVAPHERAEKIVRLLDTRPAEEVEVEVARLVAPVVERRPLGP